jgi:hypothetical protein
VPAARCDLSQRLQIPSRHQRDRCAVVQDQPANVQHTATAATRHKSLDPARGDHPSQPQDEHTAGPHHDLSPRRFVLDTEYRIHLSTAFP